MDAKKLTSALISMQVSCDEFAAGMRRLAEAANAMSAAARAGERSDWWQRGEPPTEYVADINEPEWWQAGDNEPPYGCAA